MMLNFNFLYFAVFCPAVALFALGWGSCASPWLPSGTSLEFGSAAAEVGFIVLAQERDVLDAVDVGVKAGSLAELYELAQELNPVAYLGVVRSALVLPELDGLVGGVGAGVYPVVAVAVQGVAHLLFRGGVKNTVFVVAEAVAPSCVATPAARGKKALDGGLHPHVVDEDVAVLKVGKACSPDVYVESAGGVGRSANLPKALAASLEALETLVVAVQGRGDALGGIVPADTRVGGQLELGDVPVVVVYLIHHLESVAACCCEELGVSASYAFNFYPEGVGEW